MIVQIVIRSELYGEEIIIENCGICIIEWY